MKNTPIIFCVVLILIFSSFFLFNSAYCQNSVVARSFYGKSPVVDKNNISSGYTLIAPYTPKDDSGRVYLVDLYGKTVHDWKTQNPVFYAILKPNGNLMAATVPPSKEEVAGGGGGRLMQEIDWNGNVVWEYLDMEMHHDFDILPNGNIAALVFDKLPPAFSGLIKGGTPGTEGKKGMNSDAIFEIDKDKKIVWQWHLHEHINPSEEMLSPLTPRAELGHANSLKYVEKNPIDGSESYLISIRHLNTVAIVRKSDGEIIWRSPKGFVNYQHDATMLENGNILVFDNNIYREPKPEPMRGSRVVEINPKTNKIVWIFAGGERGTEKARFKADIVSGAQRLPNGNTLIVDGTRGHLFEVTPESKLVWDFVSPYSAGVSTGPWPNTFIFKAKKYGEDQIAWPKNLPSSLPAVSNTCVSINQSLGLM